MPVPQFAVDVVAGHERHVVISGELDLDACPQLSELRDRLCDGGPGDVIIDLGGVTFCDSSALQLLVSLHATLAARGDQLVVADPSPAVVRLLALTGLTTLFNYSLGR